MNRNTKRQEQPRAWLQEVLEAIYLLFVQLANIEF